MNRYLLLTLPVLAIVGVILVSASAYKVDQTEYALILRFGEIKQVRLLPGLYFKAPFIDDIQRIDNRTQRADIPPREVPDRDKERLIIDTIVRYKIVDPVAFRTTLRNESTALERLQAIMYSAMRDTIAERDRTDVVGARQVVDENGNAVYNDQGLPVYESLIDTRDQIGVDILERVQNAIRDQNYGIEILSADIKRADFPPQVTASIIERMRSERRRVAARHRADGEEQYRKHTAAVQAEADILIAEAERDARQTRGEGDAQAISTVQEALQRDPEFYTFLRTLESYETTLGSGSTLIMPAEPDGYLDHLLRPPASVLTVTGADTGPEASPPPSPGTVQGQDESHGQSQDASDGQDGSQAPPPGATPAPAIAPEQ